MPLALLQNLDLGVRQGHDMTLFEHLLGSMDGVKIFESLALVRLLEHLLVISMIGLEHGEQGHGAVDSGAQLGLEVDLGDGVEMGLAVQGGQQLLALVVAGLVAQVLELGLRVVLQELLDPLQRGLGLEAHVVRVQQPLLRDVPVPEAVRVDVPVRLVVQVAVLPHGLGDAVLLVLEHLHIDVRVAQHLALRLLPEQVRLV